MSSKRIYKRKSKVSDELGTERHSKRLSDKKITKRQLPIESDVNSNSTSSSINCSPNTSISQYFPTQKNSPRNNSDFKLKFTRIKSSNNRINNNLFNTNENPITYGFENSFEEEYNENKIVLNKNYDENSSEIVNKREVKIDCKQLLKLFDEEMDEVVDEEVEQNNDELNFNNTDYIHNQIPNQSDNHYNCVMSSTVEIDINTYNTFDNNRDNSQTVSDDGEDSDLDSDPIFDDMISKMDVKNLEFFGNKDVIPKTLGDNSEEFDLDDSFSRMISEMPIKGNEESSVETKRDVSDDERDDDGFESDGDFDLMLSKLTNEQLMTQMDEQNTTTRSRGESSAHTSNASHSCSNLLTLEQIIELINTPL